MTNASRPSLGPFGRRTFLKGATGFTGALVSLSAFGKIVSEALGQEPPSPGHRGPTISCSVPRAQR